EPPVFTDETGGGRLIENRDAAPLHIGIERVEELRPAAPDVQCETAPEFEFSVDLVGLPSQPRLQLHTCWAIHLAVFRLPRTRISKRSGSDRYWVNAKRSSKNWSCVRSEEHTSELQSLTNLVCRLLLEKKKKKKNKKIIMKNT